jgi:uncharacterized protein
VTAPDTEPILPNITEENQLFWASLRDHDLKLPFCMRCEKAFYPPQSRCPRCLGQRLEWRQASGRARLHSWVVVHQVYDKSFADRVPYVVAAVELEEGPRLITNVVNCSPDGITADMGLKATYRDLTDEVALVQFEPDGAPDARK